MDRYVVGSNRCHLSTWLTSSSQADKPFLQRLKELPNEFAEFFEHLKFTILIPLSWFLTMFKFVRVLVWRFFVSVRVSRDKPTQTCCDRRCRSDCSSISTSAESGGRSHGCLLSGGRCLLSSRKASRSPPSQASLPAPSKVQVQSGTIPPWISIWTTSSMPISPTARAEP
jgi:hypothetical protein